MDEKLQEEKQEDKITLKQEARKEIEEEERKIAIQEIKQKLKSIDEKKREIKKLEEGIKYIEKNGYRPLNDNVTPWYPNIDITGGTMYGSGSV